MTRPADPMTTRKGRSGLSQRLKDRGHIVVVGKLAAQASRPPETMSTRGPEDERGEGLAQSAPLAAAVLGGDGAFENRVSALKDLKRASEGGA